VIGIAGDHHTNRFPDSFRGVQFVTLARVKLVELLKLGFGWFRALGVRDRSTVIRKLRLRESTYLFLFLLLIRRRLGAGFRKGFGEAFT
jgi:hypothetical protein